MPKPVDLSVIGLRPRNDLTRTRSLSNSPYRGRCSSAVGRTSNKPRHTQVGVGQKKVTEPVALSSSTPTNITRLAHATSLCLGGAPVRSQAAAAQLGGASLEAASRIAQAVSLSERG